MICERLDQIADKEEKRTVCALGRMFFVCALTSENFVAPCAPCRPWNPSTGNLDDPVANWGVWPSESDFV